LPKQLDQLVQSVPNFSSCSHSDKVKLFGWYLHTECGKERFVQSDIRGCYDELHLQHPANISSYFTSLGNTKPKQILKDSRGYYLEKRVREQFDKRHGQRSATVIVHKLLTDLPSKVPNLQERTFLDEAITCFRHGAFRAAIVMAWNLAFDHLCNYVFAAHLVAFNTQLPKSYPKASISSIATRENFAELKEFDVLQVCKSAGIITNDVFKIMREKLDRRNTAAHPSSVVITQLQAEDFITDLVNNVVVKLV
jgi:hypothetical protein